MQGSVQLAAGVGPGGTAIGQGTGQQVHTAMVSQKQSCEVGYQPSSVGIYCVSTNYDDVLMWSHYADSHKGICLEFDGFGS
jgi:hypothetical protein